MRRVRLTKVRSTHENLRDDVIEGETPGAPEVGRRFVLYAEPRDGGDVRILRTTPVIALRFPHGEGYFEFQTENSTYRLEDLN